MSKEEIFQAGELEHKKAFEETATKNIKTVVDYTTETREVVRELQGRIDHMEKIIQGQNEKIDMFVQQLAVVQGKLYANGTE